MSENENLPLEQSLQVTVSEDKLQAFLLFKRVEGTMKVTPRELEQYLNAQGIRHGILQDTLYLIAQKPQDFYFTQNIVAIGTEPTNGKDGYINYIYDSKEKAHSPTERDDGSVDYKEVTQLANVKTGQLIAERVAAEQGKPGKSVSGDEIKPKDGKDIQFKVGKNVVLNAEKTSMYAAIDGLVSKTDKDKLNVFPVFEVNGDVDYKVGNIDFVGTVVVRGNILTGFRVRASGDIRVTGGIEGAEVESDGSIEISGGIIGSNKGYVKAGRNIRCSFVQEGNVIAGDEIVVTQSIMHSNVRAGKLVQCAGAKGLIVGGLIQAGDRVTARMIGNSMYTPTTIEVGVRPELRQELNDLRVSLRQLNENIDKTDKALALLDQLASTGQLPPDKLAMRIKLSSTKRQSTEEVTTIKERILEIEKTLEDASTARVDAVNTLWGGTKVVIGRYTRFIKDNSQRVSLRFLDGDIVLVPFF
ncbi:MAG: FapA family protein [Candidatus Cohnella colombiensis]|uniref:FapA family protein n=1 Tax=Candidatus Cohnella colombiensis TaxID=3121368 RepID=A0AA95F6Z2_9BACL|nr:MAG: FapA family protein [Cohnella sp.]